MRVLNTLRNGWFVSVLAAVIGVSVLVSSWPEGGAPSASAQWRPGGTRVTGSWAPRVETAFIELGSVDSSEDRQDETIVSPNPVRSIQVEPRTPRELKSPGLGPASKPPSLKPTIRMYTVQKGDRYWTIAERLLGSGSLYKQIQQLNPKVPAKKLRPGIKIRVPVDPGSTVKTEPGRDIKKASPPADRPKLRFHVVRAGESLSEIASRFYTDGNWRRIYRANTKKIKNPNRVKKGTMLLIPWAPGKERTS
ncbi:MAG: LysM peptidoglycan-binding domain-containing protein [Planctomycetota bacterium]